MRAPGWTCGDTSEHASHGQCPGRVKCVVCRRTDWRDAMEKITELRTYNGRHKHRGCRIRG